MRSSLGAAWGPMAGAGPGVIDLLVATGKSPSLSESHFSKEDPRALYLTELA